MPKRPRSGKGASKGSKAKRRAIARYGADAVAKYYSPVRHMVRAPGETGYVDLASASYALDTTGSVTLLATIPQGTSVSQRVGKKIMIKSIQCRGNLQNNSTATINDVAMMLVYDIRPTGSLPVVTDILVSASSRAFNNDVNSARFKILKRIDMSLTGNSGAATGSTAVSCDFYLKVNKLMQFAAAGTGAIGDITVGALYLVTVGTNAAGTTAATAVVGFRTRFNDI